MGEVRAFVGHSFAEDDAKVVGIFLKYFEQLAKLNPAFAWQHAENAEPRQLADKVKQLIADKNVFIGICTKKEVALPSAAAIPMWFRPDDFRVKQQSMTWKTSDWIIQEIGLAIGRNLALILLLEEGVRAPGGLQGNIEYIPFDRTSPEKSFGKIAEMITALSPTVSQTSVSLPDMGSPTGAESTPPPADNDWNVPKATWKRRDYEMAMWRAILFKDESAMSSLNESYLKTEQAATKEHRDSWEAYCEHTVLLFGKGGSLAKLRAFAEQHPENSRVLSYFASGLSHHEKHEEAARAFLEAARVTTDSDEQLRLMGKAAIASAKASETTDSLKLIEEMRKAVAGAPKNEIRFLRTLQELAQIKKLEDLELAVMERMIDIDPDNSEIRYNLALKHSERGNRELALAHYLGIPYDERASAAWNNLGVELHNASLKGLSVKAYRRSEEMGETLAMSNLARLLSGAGFLTEAEELCNKALKTEDYDKHVLGTMERLKEIPEEEGKKESEIVERAKSSSDFYKKLGHAASMQYTGGLEGQWKGPECTFEVKVTDQQFVAIGTFTKPRARRGLLSRGLMESASTSDVATHKIEYRGTIYGRTIVAEVVRTSDEPATGLGSLMLGDNDKGAKVLLAVNETNDTIGVMEGMGSNNHSFHSLARI